MSYNGQFGVNLVQLASEQPLLSTQWTWAYRCQFRWDTAAKPKLILRSGGPLSAGGFTVGQLNLSMTAAGAQGQTQDEFMADAQYITIMAPPILKRPTKLSVLQHVPIRHHQWPEAFVSYELRALPQLQRVYDVGVFISGYVLPVGTSLERYEKDVVNSAIGCTYAIAADPSMPEGIALPAGSKVH